MNRSNVKPNVMITIVSLTIGFMLAIQFTSSKEPVVTGSRDNIELRIDLQKERQRKEGILNDLSKAEQLLYEYENSVDTNSVDILLEQLEKVKLSAGLIPVEGEGFIIRIDHTPQVPMYDDEYFDEVPFSFELTDEDIRTLVNELFNNNAEAVSINGHRIVSTSTIRNIGDRIQVNTHFIDLPLEVRVLGESDNIILSITGMDEYFKIVNLELVYEKKSFLQIPAYDDMFAPRYMKPVKDGGL
ncbi:MAG: DUF881 domain-containing protein [Bacilli bacterium]